MSTSARLTGRQHAFFILIVALIAATVALGIAAWSHDGYRLEMLVAAGGAGTLAAMFAAFLLFVQIGQQHHARQAVARLEARVRDIVDTTMDPIITVDEDQHIVLFNAAAENVFQWPRDAILGQPLDRLIPASLRDAHRAHVKRFGDAGTTKRHFGHQTVLVALRANGEEFPIEASISQHTEDGRKYFTVILRDVSGRLRTESQLARSEARLQGILDSAMDAIVTADADQRIVLFNAAAESLFGCTRDEAIGAPLTDFMPASARPLHVEHVRRFGGDGVASRRMGSMRTVTGCRRDNGQEFPIDASISQLTEHGRTFYTAILRDVSARVQAEAALRQSKEQLQQLSAAVDGAREQEKNRIARELHDDLGQALTMLQMDVAWCREKMPAGEASLVPRLDRMAALLAATVAATRRIAADLRPLLLDDLGLVPAVEWLVDNFRQRANIPCELAVSNPGMHVPASHSTAVFRVVQEALTNITKHAEATRVEVAIDLQSTALAVSIRDDGKGFDSAHARKAGSFGLLGLRERAYLLGGDATITSRPGTGTVIEVLLPIPQDPEEP
jgi:PAS domain S-box-containing protein